MAVSKSQLLHLEKQAFHKSNNFNPISLKATKTHSFVPLSLPFLHLFKYTFPTVVKNWGLCRNNQTSIRVRKQGFSCHQTALYKTRKTPRFWKYSILSSFADSSRWLTSALFQHLSGWKPFKNWGLSTFLLGYSAVYAPQDKLVACDSSRQNKEHAHFQ